MRIRALSVFEGVVYHCWPIDRSDPERPTLDVAGATPHAGALISDGNSNLSVRVNLGQGRTAIVYRAHHEGLGIDVTTTDAKLKRFLSPTRSTPPCRRQPNSCCGVRP